MAPVTRLERDSTLPLGTATVQRLEDIILTRARDLRRAASAG